MNLEKVNDKNEKVSVIITTYHNEALLPRAIESVMNQSYKDTEIIVVDDNDPKSPERAATERVMENYPNVKYVKHSENKNGAAARNTGLLNAEGKYIAFLDNDDVYLSEHLKNCVEALRNNPECSCVMSDVLKVCSGLCWDVVKAPKGDLVKTLLLSETALGTGSNLFLTKAAADELEGFDVSFQRHQDVEFGLRLFSRFKACTVDKTEILKEMDGFSNAPKFDKFLNTKKHLWEKFEDIINTLSEDERKRFFSSQYSSLLYAACKEQDNEKIAWAKEQITHYRELSKKEKLMISITNHKMFNFYEKLKYYIKSSKSQKIYKSVVASLSNGDREIIDEMLTVKK